MGHLLALLVLLAHGGTSVLLESVEVHSLYLQLRHKTVVAYMFFHSEMFLNMTKST